MPALTKCAACGFDGPHGFTMGVMSMMHYYHSPESRGDDRCGGFWTIPRSTREFTSRQAAWNAYRGQFPNDNWRKAWDALILKGSERSYNRYMRLWQNESGNFGNGHKVYA